MTETPELPENRIRDDLGAILPAVVGHRDHGSRSSSVCRLRPASICGRGSSPPIWWRPGTSCHEAGFYLASFQSISTHEERKRTHFSAIKISSYTFALRSLNQPEAANLVGPDLQGRGAEAWQRIQAHESDEGINDMEHPYSQDIAEIAFAALAIIEAKPNLRRLAFGRFGHLVQSRWAKSVHHKWADLLF